MKAKFFTLSAVLIVFLVMFLGVSFVYAGGTDPYGRDDQNRKVVKQGLLGAATGAISAEASGGKAGTGALVGAGTNVVGGALLDTLTAPSQPQPQAYHGQPQQYPQQQAYSAQPAQGYAPQAQPVYYQDPPRQPVYAQPAYPAYPQQEDPNKKILKQGLLGAGTGAIAASSSGGKAGKGALIGAGTNILGGILLDTLSQPSQPQQQQRQQQYYYQPQAQSPAAYPAQQQPTRRVIRKYDAEGNIISEEEVYE